MAISDISNNLKQTQAILPTVFDNTGSVVGAILDTAEFELGLMFTVNVADYTDGNYALTLEESNDPNMVGAVQITGDKLIGSLQTISAAIAAGEDIPTVGVISNLRYVRATITTVGGVENGSTVSVVATQKTEYMPV